MGVLYATLAKAPARPPEEIAEECKILREQIHSLLQTATPVQLYRIRELLAEDPNTQTSHRGQRISFLR